MGNRFFTDTSQTTTLEFVYIRDGVAQNAESVSEVKIYPTYTDAVADTNLTETITTITSNSGGNYSYETSVITTSGLYFDKIFLIPVTGEAEVSYINSFNVLPYTGFVDPPAQISTRWLNQIKRIQGFPEITNLDLSDDNIKEFAVFPALHDYFTRFPIKTPDQRNIGNNTSLVIPFPNDYVFGVLDARVVGKEEAGTQTNDFWSLYYYNTFRKESLGQSGAYGTPYNFEGTKQGEMMERQIANTVVNTYATFKTIVDQGRRTLTVYSSVSAELAITWASYSYDFAYVKFARQFDVIKRAQAYLLKTLADKGSIVDDTNQDITINSEGMYTKAEQLLEEIDEKWKEFPDIIYLRFA